MAESPKEYQVQEGGWRNYLALLSFSYRTFIAPWPPFALFVIAIAALALVTPTLVVYATTGLVDAVTQDPASPDDSIFELVGLFLCRGSGFFWSCERSQVYWGSTRCIASWV